jgi:hypothetical protein
MARDKAPRSFADGLTVAQPFEFRIVVPGTGEPWAIPPKWVILTMNLCGLSGNMMTFFTVLTLALEGRLETFQAVKLRRVQSKGLDKKVHISGYFPV